MSDITSTLAAASPVNSMAAPAPTPTAVFTPGPACLDPANSANYWAVTTSCYLNNWDRPDRPQYPQYMDGHPDWLQCSVTMFGVPEYGQPEESTCLIGWGLPSFTVATNDAGEEEGPKTYYEGCPVGYAPAAVATRAGYLGYYSTPEGSFDITVHATTCCPTAYPFQVAPFDLGQTSSTSHDRQSYGLFVYPMPRCYATSIKALSGGKELPLQTTSNSKAWDKRQEAPEPTPAAAVTWDYEGGTLYALGQYVSHTVFMGTHTCYESCDEWQQFYYPDRTGGPGTPNTEAGEVTMARPSETDVSLPPPMATPTHDGEENSSAAATVTAATAPGSGGSSSGSESGGGSQSGKPADPADAEPSSSQSPDVSLASRIRGEITVGSCSIFALMIPLLVATLVL
ncbi:hypothetical protein PG984_014407 [Apiospora sp. TS-2023a]